MGGIEIKRPAQPVNRCRASLRSLAPDRFCYELRNQLDQEIHQDTPDAAERRIKVFNPNNTN
jgi:hypothetical protein